MKKSVAFLLTIMAASLSVLSGCNISKNKVLLSFGDVHASEVTLVDDEALSNLIDNKESFMFVVSSNTCTCWSTGFRPVINKYVSENKLICYQMPFEDFKLNSAKFKLTDISSSTTTFAIYEKGEVKKTLKSTDDKNIMEDYKTFCNYMDQNTKKPGCYFINEEDIKTIKESGKSAVIYYERSLCGDCSAINPGILRDYYLNKKATKHIYVLDCQPWKSLDAESYQTKKDEFGLSTTNNEKFGFGKGVFPTFQLIDNGQYTSGAVIYNDTLEASGDNYVIKESYFTNERLNNIQYMNKKVKTNVLEGLTISASDVNVSEYGASWKHECADKYYQPILNAFLDYALKITNFNF